MQRKPLYIHDLPQWPTFGWRTDAFLNLLLQVRHLQGRVMGKIEGLGFEMKNEASLDTITLDVLKSSEIEGEILNVEQVRSSIARRLGIDLAMSVEADRHVEGVVEMMLDATQNCYEELGAERLYAWHAALFPTGRSGMYKIDTGKWRSDSTGPIQVVSGALGKEKVHFEAPASQRLPYEMEKYITWFNTDHEFDPILKAAIAHIWFLSIHPFEDGNGRIARALTDLLLARADGSTQRFYSMSAQIRVERKQYYNVLERTQKGNLDITDWISWFLQCLLHALKSTQLTLNRVLYKAEFWQRNATTLLNTRQSKILNNLLDGFEGKLSSSKWAKIGKCSRDTAIRDINDLMAKGILQRDDSGGRSTGYVLV